MGKNARHKLTLKGKDLNKFSVALEGIETVFQNQRHSFTVDMRQPVFSATDEVKHEAQKQAVADARKKAEVLAQAANIYLGGAIRIQELDKAHRNSGAYGDYDWGGDVERFYAAPVAGSSSLALEEPELPLIGEPKRTIWVRYAVRFAMQELKSAT